MFGARPCSFPMDQQHHLQATSGDPIPDSSIYRCLIGRLIYLTITRPKLTYSVRILSQFMQDPRVAHHEAAMRALLYIKSSPGQGILLSPTNDWTILGFCDSD